MNSFKSLRKDNNRLEKKLARENKDLYTDMIVYLRSSSLYNEKVEEIRQDLLYMFLDSQQNQENIHARIGDDPKQFCDEIIDCAPRKTKLESILEVIEIIAIDTLMLMMVIFFISPDALNRILHLFSGQDMSQMVHIPIVSVLVYITILLVTLISGTHMVHSIFSSCHKHHLNTRIIISIMSGLTAGLMVCILLLFDYENNTFTLPLSILLIAIMISMILLIITSIIIRHLHNKHIQATDTIIS